ncbi:MAG: ribosome maturation factor RimM [Nautiliaceae bacterium]
MKNKKIPIAKIGKSFGVRGWQKLHILSDFPEQFKKGASFKSDRVELTIEDIDLKRGLVKFKGVNSPEDAKKLTNRTLYTTPKKTKEEIELKEGEYFWFDIEGCDIFEKIDNKEVRVGKVVEIERADEDYLVIEVDEKLREKGYPKRLLINFKRNVKDVDVDNKKIIAIGAFELLDSLK